MSLVRCLFICIALLAIAVPANAASTTLNIRVNASADDAEQASDNSVLLNGVTLDLGQEPWIGMRFNSVTIPQGAYIISAYVTFTGKDAQSATSTMTVFGQAADNAATFTTTASDVSNRTRTSASVSWSAIPSWSADVAYNSPELKTLVQEVVNRSGWSSGNSMAMIFQGTSGHRTAYSYDSSTTKAPLLHVEYVVVTRPIASRLLFVVTSTSSPNAQEVAHKDFFTAIGYTVTLMAATAAQSSYDTSAAVNDVAYIGEEITSTDLNTKLKGKPLGIVSEEPALADDYAWASGYTNPSAATITIAKNNHYITSPFSTGSLTILNSSQALNAFSGTFAPDIDVLGTTSGSNALMVVEAGGKLYDGTKAAGRRVQLPYGGNGFDFTATSADGYVLLSRTLAWAGGLVGWWKLDETSGTAAADSSVNANNGTLTNSSFATASATGKVGTALTVDGADDYITIANVSTLQLTKAMSMSAWVKGSGSWGTGSSANAIIRKGDANPNNYQFAVENGYVALGLDGNDGSNAHGNTLLTLGTWYHVAATWDGANIRIYVNGVLDNTPAARAAPTSTDTRPLFLVGRSGSTDIFNGVLDDLRLFNHALDVDEITVLKTQGQTLGVHITKWLETQ